MSKRQYSLLVIIIVIIAGIFLVKGRIFIGIMLISLAVARHIIEDADEPVSREK